MACTSPGKHPVGSAAPRGHRDATSIRSKVKKWWRTYPEANIGIRCGRETDLLVLDVDPRNGGDKALADLIAAHEPLPKTPRVHTGGGGYHILFRHAEGMPNKLAGGIDVKGSGAGGYVVAAPSLHVSGLRYRWAKGQSIFDLTLAPLPDWLISYTRTQERSLKNAGPYQDFVQALPSHSLPTCAERRAFEAHVEQGHWKLIFDDIGPMALFDALLALWPYIPDIDKPNVLRGTWPSCSRIWQHKKQASLMWRYIEELDPTWKPTAPILLYRGVDNLDYLKGMSWTVDIKTARFFAEDHVGDGMLAGYVYTTQADPTAILAVLDNVEGEYIVDPDLLGEIKLYKRIK